MLRHILGIEPAAFAMCLCHMPNVRKPTKKIIGTENLVTALHIGASSVSLMVAERAEDGTTEKMVVSALPWNMRSGSHLHGAPPCGSAPQVPRSISEATIVVPSQRRF